MGARSPRRAVSSRSAKTGRSTRRRRALREEDFRSRVDSAIVEQAGAVRTVVKIVGVHQAAAGQRAWLPFTVRLYFHAGVDSLRMVHSFVYDGDQEQDYLKGLGVRFSVPLREQLHNRHVRLVGEPTGVFAEPVRMIAGRRMPSQELYTAQIAGQAIPDLDALPLQENIAMMAAWDSFKLVQHTSDSFTIAKRTGTHSAWIPSARRTARAGAGVCRRYERRAGAGDAQLLAARADGIGDQKRGDGHGGTDRLALVPRCARDGHAPLRRRRTRPGSLLRRHRTRVQHSHGDRADIGTDPVPLRRRPLQRRLAPAGRDHHPTTPIGLRARILPCRAGVRRLEPAGPVRPAQGVA